MSGESGPVGLREPEPSIPEEARSTGGPQLRQRRGVIGRLTRLTRRTRWTLAAVIVVLAGLQAASTAFPPYLLPGVPTIMLAVGEIFVDHLDSVRLTLTRFFAVLLASVLVGWVLGLFMGANRRAGNFFEALFKIVIATPALSWILLAVLWIRTIEIRIFFVALLLALPFYVIAVYEGTKELDNELIEAVEQFRPNRWQRLALLLIPHSVVGIIVTTKTVSGFVARILIFAELIGANSGIGSEMARAQAQFRVDLLLAWTVILIIFSFTFLALVQLAESRILRWRPTSALDRGAMHGA